MAVSKMNILAGALAFMGAFAPCVIATEPLTACSSTEPAVSSQLGSATADGQVLYSWSVCSIIHQTNCETSTSTAVPSPSSTPVVLPSAPGASSAPPQGETTGPEGAYSVPGGSQPGNPSETAPGATVPGQPGYTLPGTTGPGATGPGATGPGETATGSVPAGEPTPTLITTTDSTGASTTITGTPTHSGHYGSVSVSGSASGVHPSASGTEGVIPSGTTGAPGASATGAGAMLNAFPGAVLGAAGMAVVYFL